MCYRDAQLANVYTSPIQYNSATGTARIHRSFSVLVDYGENQAVPSMPEGCKTDPVLQSLLTMPDENSSIMRESESPKPYSEEKKEYYLIITTNDLKESAEKLSKWRKTTGYETQIYTQSKWIKAQVKAAIKYFYDTYSFNAKYFVILGDTTKVPAFEYDIPRERREPGGDTQYCSDRDYALITNTLFENMSYGRIPLNTVNELDAVISKIEKYEKNITNKRNKQFVGIADFQDKNKDGFEDYYGFTRSVESVCQNLEDQYDSITRLYGYKLVDSCVAKGWDRGTSPEFPFPKNLNDYFLKDGWKAWPDIETVVNKGADYILANLHGRNKGWNFPEFFTDYFGVLKNTQYPIIFSLSCDTGMYNYTDNFARNILAKSNGGCAAIVAATQPTSIAGNEYFLLALMNGIWPEKQFNHYGNNNVFNFGSFSPGALTVGEALTLANSKLIQYHKNDVEDMRSYHCLGDPALALTHGKDNTIAEKAVIERNTDCVTVNTQSIGYCNITICDGKTMKRIYGNLAVLETDYPLATTVYISKPGLNPYYDELKFIVIGPGNPGKGFLKSINSKSPSEIEIDCASYDNLKVRVAESSAVNVNNISEIDVKDGTVIYPIKDTSNRLFFISLLQNGEVLESKTYYNK